MQIKTNPVSTRRNETWFLSLAQTLSSVTLVVLLLSQLRLYG